MTDQERAAIEAAASAPDRLTWTPDRLPGMVRLAAGPCPLLTTDAKGRAACSVWDVRPYTCRRFGCYRPDPKAEPYEPEPYVEALGLLGCRNLTDRIQTSREVRRAYGLNQRHAQRWARAHGWQES